MPYLQMKIQKKILEKSEKLKKGFLESKKQVRYMKENIDEDMKKSHRKVQGYRGNRCFIRNYIRNNLTN